MSKPVVALVAGRTAPSGRRFGHAGAIIRTGVGQAEEKVNALRAAGAFIADTPSQIPVLLKECMT
jgi:succinyl-CoA synthetase alpha subunit